MSIKLDVDREVVMEFCQRWRIKELAFFGSVLRDDFDPDSDVDVLVTFLPDATPGLFDHMDMEEELSRIIGRTVDLVSRRAVEASTNDLRRQAILSSAESFHVA
jgi:predicted nucleotidyltransferase